MFHRYRSFIRRNTPDRGSRALDSPASSYPEVSPVTTEWTARPETSYGILPQVG